MPPPRGDIVETRCASAKGTTASRRCGN